jgi:cell wall-associated NlpC family hydrolase
LAGQRQQLAGADAGVQGWSQQVAADAAAGRRSAAELLGSARATGAALAPYAHTVPGRVALVTALGDHLARAGDLVSGQAAAVAARRQQLTALAAQYALAPPHPPAPPPPRHPRPRRRMAPRRGSAGGGGGGGSPARYRMSGGFGSFAPPGFSPLSMAGGLARGGGTGMRGVRSAGGGGVPGVVPMPGGGNGVGSQVVNFASAKLGVMYAWGGDGSARWNGRVDCSGLMQWAYARAGIEIGRDTYTQIGQGFQVPPSQIRPGDLIFCNFGALGKDGPGHVVMATGYGAASRVIEASQAVAPVAFGSMPSGHIVVKRMIP